jgi:polyisoprenyl-teichoic acid--peptidoglycan teichoic acid transferase
MAPSISRDKIKRGIIGPPDQVLFAKSPDGKQDILKPIPSKIRLLRDDIFAPEVFSPAAAVLDDEALLREEQANVSVLNGSGAGGLAARTSEFLAGLGTNVIVAGDAGQAYTNTTIVDYTGNPYTVRYLAGLMKVRPGQIRLEYNPDSELDVVVYLGSDWANNNSLP